MKQAFIFLAVVNALDAGLTVIGLHYNLIAEANPFMKLLYEIHPLLFAGFKLSFSIFLFLFIYLLQVLAVVIGSKIHCLYGFFCIWDYFSDACLLDSFNFHIKRGTVLCIKNFAIAVISRHSAAVRQNDGFVQSAQMI